MGTSLLLPFKRDLNGKVLEVPAWVVISREDAEESARLNSYMVQTPKGNKNGSHPKLEPNRDALQAEQCVFGELDSHEPPPPDLSRGVQLRHELPCLGFSAGFLWFCALRGRELPPHPSFQGLFQALGKEASPLGQRKALGGRALGKAGLPRYARSLTGNSAKGLFLTVLLFFS